MAVTLINPFEIPAGQEEQFIQSWHETAAVMRAAPGYISTRLHKSLDPQAKFRFINVAQWESVEHFRAAIQSPAFLQTTQKMPFTAYPALYQVIFNDPS